MSTQDVLNHHLGAFGAGDAKDAASDFTDDSVLITPEGQTVGRAAIESAFAEMFAGLFKPGTFEFGMDRMEVEGDVAYIAWHADCSTHEIPTGTDTFVVRDGKIAVQTFTMHMVPK